jgi:hypothetical protein
MIDSSEDGGSISVSGQERHVFSVAAVAGPTFVGW